MADVFNVGQTDRNAGDDRFAGMENCDVYRQIVRSQKKAFPLQKVLHMLLLSTDSVDNQRCLCSERESNPYGHHCPQDFKSCVSTYSTIRASSPHFYTWSANIGIFGDYTNFRRYFSIDSAHSSPPSNHSIRSSRPNQVCWRLAYRRLLRLISSIALSRVIFPSKYSKNSR